MKKFLLISGILYASGSLAAESTMLREIMGKSVYEESGITELSEEQLETLEKWILKNAVSNHVVTLPATRLDKKSEKPSSPQIEARPESKEPSKAAPQQNAMSQSPSTQNSVDKPLAAPATPQRYVKLSETPPEISPEEEPATQKYVRIESLEEGARSQIKPDLIRSRIDGAFKGWRNNKTRFRLENGEIWEQRQSSTYITNLDSPEVVIKKTRFGYTMEVPAIGRSVHVKRIR
ncbi:MAG: hypothetical protein ACI8Z1_002848 [Candidatus Azotimanducaceae bacterium]|jgi:hypothetical protein